MRLRADLAFKHKVAHVENTVVQPGPSPAEPVSTRLHVKEPSIRVAYASPGGEGYHPVYYMARLAAEILSGELVIVDLAGPSLAKRIEGAFFPRRRGPLACLVICPSPTALQSVLAIEKWRQSYRSLVAWVFDSFWTDSIPLWVQVGRIFDHVFVTEQEDLPAWRRKIRAPVDWLPWGSDVLNLGSPNPTRRFDLIRFGRQPEEWDDDLSNQQQCQRRMMSFHGRPPSFDDAADNERALLSLLGSTKFTLAFSNRVSPSIQTHPNREYITARWTDSLAAGAAVAGIPPRSESVQSLLWPEALLDIKTVTRSEGLDIIASAARDWTPARAQLNYLKALQFLDWRWRFKTIAETLGVRSLQLDTELARLRNIIDSSPAAGAAG